MLKNWCETRIDHEQVDFLVEKTGVSPIVGALLVGRGITEPEQAVEFLNPDLSQTHDGAAMRGVSEAAVLVCGFIERGEEICVYGDYDVDGITSTLLLESVIKSLGGRVTGVVPDRFADGYGIGERQVTRLIDEGFRLIITVDNGISAHKAVDLARSNGVAVIVVDHHEVSGSVPAADIVIDPRQADCQYPFKDLAGVGVTFKLAQELARLRGNPGLAFDYIDLVAVGTVADMVSLTGENRVLVSEGLDRINKQTRPGLLALKKECGITGDLNAGHIGFLLAPRLNAAGRMGSTAKALELLRTSDPAEARSLARLLDDCNKRRQSAEKDMLQDAVSVVETMDWQAQHALVLSSADWHDGVKGIVASRIVERYYRPTILFSAKGEILKGSGRSVKRVDMHKALASCADLLLTCGGHPMAAGLSLHASKLDEFVERFQRAVSEQLPVEAMIPELSVDLTVDLADIDSGMLADINKMAPFGLGNPTPVLATYSTYLEGAQRLGDGDHVRFLARQDSGAIEAVAFNVRDVESVMAHAGPADIAFQLNERNWGRECYLQVKLVDMKLLPFDDGMEVDPLWFAQLEEPFESLADLIRTRESRVASDPGKGHAAPVDVERLRIIDERRRSDRDEFVYKLIARRQPTVVYVSNDHAAVELAENLSLKMGSRPPVAFVVDNMPPELCRLISKGFMDGQITTVVAGTGMLADMGIHARNLVLYHPPLGLGQLVSLCSSLQAPEGLAFVYLLYGKKDLEITDKLVSAAFPDRRGLAELYRHMASGADPGSFPRQALALAGLRIFEELGLVAAEGEPARLASGTVGEKLDLEDSPTYASLRSYRDSYNKFRANAMDIPARQLLNQLGVSKPPI